MTINANLSHPKYRPDIDGLRAVAVLAVVVFHVFPDWLEGGFIGVDVFFVISGFLISSIIFENLDKGTFSFSEFYARRIRRIFPALLVMLISSLIFGWFVLLPEELNQLGKHVAAGAGFVSNIVLWNEVEYFDSAADKKPLLHLWSLGIEEQFYIAWPLVVWLAWKKRLNILFLSMVAVLVSMVFNVNVVHQYPDAAFYCPLTRFWELLCGSVLAWCSLYKLSDVVVCSRILSRWLPQSLYGKSEQAPSLFMRHCSDLFSADYPLCFPRFEPGSSRGQPFSAFQANSSHRHQFPPRHPQIRQHE